VHADLVEAEQVPGDEVEAVDAGLLRVPHVLVEHRTAVHRLRHVQEQRLITAEGPRQAEQTCEQNGPHRTEPGTPHRVVRIMSPVCPARIGGQVPFGLFR
jgi:hypothetical protein